MDINTTILTLARRQKTFTTQDVLDALHGQYTRAYVLRFLNRLILSGDVVKSGSTRASAYALRSKQRFLPAFFEKLYFNHGLEEHKIWEEFLRALPFIRSLPEHIRSILVYAFSEMVNNAIDHSTSDKITVRMEKIKEVIRFSVEDWGIGVFYNVLTKRRLRSELEAIQDILKGKTTTMPHAHSGEGIFFTSKVADIFVLESHELQLSVDNLINDVFINELHPRKTGTRVLFEINENHSGHLHDVFKSFYTDPEELDFDKTEIRVKLYAMGSVYISRSQAKRILSGLDKFRAVILDFDKIPGVGQAFADEVFRVFRNRHPSIELIPVNMNEAVRFMVERAGGST